MKWISVNERLPETTHTMSCGNKYSEDVLVTDGEDCYVANLEAVRPFFEVKVWAITQSDVEINGVTHWMPLPPPPEVKP